MDELREMLSTEPNMGVDPRTLRSRPEPKADTCRLSHPGAPRGGF